MRRDELKPCPFCGGKPFIQPNGRLGYKYWEVVCDSECDFTGPARDTEEEAAAAWNRRSSAALSIEQTQPVQVKALEWRREAPYHVARVFGGLYAVEAWDGGVTLSGIPGRRDFKDIEAAKAAAQQDYETRILSALVNAEADADVVERWQPIDTAPRDGTPVDLWGVNHLHPRKTGRRATDVTWGRVRDWLGNERDDWQHGQGDDFEPTHWCPVPAAPLSSLRPAEVGSATKSKGQSNG